MFRIFWVMLLGLGWGLVLSYLYNELRIFLESVVFDGSGFGWFEGFIF